MLYVDLPGLLIYLVDCEFTRFNAALDHYFPQSCIQHPSLQLPSQPTTDELSMLFPGELTAGTGGVADNSDNRGAIGRALHNVHFCIKFNQ